MNGSKYVMAVSGIVSALGFGYLFGKIDGVDFSSKNIEKPQNRMSSIVKGMKISKYCDGSLVVSDGVIKSDKLYFYNLEAFLGTLRNIQEFSNINELHQTYSGSTGITEYINKEGTMSAMVDLEGHVVFCRLSNMSDGSMRKLQRMLSGTGYMCRVLQSGYSVEQCVS